MLKAHWSGYEIDSSEAAYEVKVKEPEELGSLVRALLGSGYFVRGYYMLSEVSMERLRDFIAERGDPEDKLTARALNYLEKQMAKFDREEGYKITTIGVRAIKAILNYAGAHRHELVEAQVFRFDLTEEQKEYWEDVGADFEFAPGQWIDESDYYSEEEIPWDGVVMALGCNLVGLHKLPPAEQKKARTAVRRTDVMIQQEEGRRGSGTGGRGMNEIDMFFSSLFGPRDPWENYNRPQPLSLRVRLNPDATFTITGRWMDDGQFAYGYYEYVLKQAAKRAGAKMGFHMVY